MTQERDCNSCRFHVQERSLDDCPPRCWDCTKAPTLPYWEPYKEDKKMSDGMTEMAQERRIDVSKAKTALETQVGGGHYKEFVIQPIEFCMVNGLNACQTKVVKYVTRRKGDLPKMLEDLDKAIHVIQLYKQLLQAGKVASVNPL